MELRLLIARLYFDEDADVRLAEALRQRGYDVETTVEAGLLEASDEEQLAYAVSRQRALVTHNSDKERGRRGDKELSRVGFSIESLPPHRISSPNPPILGGTPTSAGDSPHFWGAGGGLIREPKSRFQKTYP